MRAAWLVSLASAATVRWTDGGGSSRAHSADDVWDTGVSRLRLAPAVAGAVGIAASLENDLADRAGTPGGWWELRSPNTDPWCLAPLPNSASKSQVENGAVNGAVINTTRMQAKNLARIAVVAVVMSNLHATLGEAAASSLSVFTLEKSSDSPLATGR